MRIRILCYALPLLLFAPDALAWGLQTHVFFAQSALLALPLADDRFRRAIVSLARADQVPRLSGLPRLSRRVVRILDRQLVPRFEAYVRETHSRLNRLEGLVAGSTPALRADPPRHAARSAFNTPLPVLLPESLT